MFTTTKVNCCLFGQHILLPAPQQIVCHFFQACFSEAINTTQHELPGASLRDAVPQPDVCDKPDAAIQLANASNCNKRAVHINDCIEKLKKLWRHFGGDEERGLSIVGSIVCFKFSFFLISIPPNGHALYFIFVKD